MHGVYKQGNLPYLAVKSCPQCEQLVPLNVESCPHCNYNFTSKNMATTQLRVKKANKEVVDETLSLNKNQTNVVEKKSEKFVFCDNCGAKIIGSQRYCGGCGAKVSKRICPSCDQIVDANLTFCPLCGERLQENNGNVTPTEAIVTNQILQPTQNPVTQQTYGAQPINIYLNPTTGQAVVNDQTTAIPNPQAELEETKQVEEPVVEEEVEENKPSLINMGRKRLFLIIQLLLVGVIAAIMVMVPILTKDTFFNALIPCVTGKSNETMVAGKDMFTYVLEIINNKAISFNSSSVIYPKIINGSGDAIFTSMSFVGVVFNFISKNPESLNVTVAMVVVVLVYFLLVLSLLISFLSGLFGLFIKRPYRGKTLGFVLFSLVFASLLVYTSTFFAPFKGYDSWLLYALALVFFVWFIVKLVFTKEARRYKEAKEAEKLLVE